MDAKERLKAVHDARADFFHTVPQTRCDIFNARTDARYDVLADIDRAGNHFFCAIPDSADSVTDALADICDRVLDSIKRIVYANPYPDKLAEEMLKASKMEITILDGETEK